MALKGTLQDFSLADIFQLIGIQRKTGVLTLKRDQEVFSIMFADGHVVGAESARRRTEDRLGTVLVKTGRITEGQLREALAVQQQTLKMLGNVLVESKMIDSQALREALQVQTSQMIYRLFRWSRGEYDFDQGARVEYDKDFVVPMSAESILMEGARIVDEWPMIEKGIRSLSAVYRHGDVEIATAAAGAAPREGQDATVGPVTLSDEEQQVHRLVDGRRSVQEIVERSRLTEFETCRMLYELINRQLIEEVSAPSPRGSVPAPAVHRATPAVLFGIGYLLLVVVAGGAVLYRSLPWLSQVAAADRLAPALAPLVGEAEVRTMREAVAESRRERIDLAIQVYYLLNRGYPIDLRYLVTTGLLHPEDILDAGGRAYRYEVLLEGYQLNSP